MVIDQLKKLPHQEINAAKGDQLILPGNNVYHLPVVLKGLIKVYSSHEDKRHLLYYIEPSETCMLSLKCLLTHQSSFFYAEAELDSKLLLIPSDQVQNIMLKEPSLTKYLLEQHTIRFDDLFKSYQAVVHHSLKERLINYLKEKKVIQETNEISITHGQLANDLGSAREVISRLLKSLEVEGVLILTHGKIILL